MEAKLIEYDYTYEDWDACKGLREKESSNRAVLFFDEQNCPVAAAIPRNGKLEIEQVLLQDKKLYLPVWSKKYMPIKHELAPFQRYRVIKSLAIPPEYLDMIMHAVMCSMKMDDLRKFLIELIRAESKGFDYRI